MSSNTYYITCTVLKFKIFVLVVIDLFTIFQNEEKTILTCVIYFLGL